MSKPQKARQRKRLRAVDNVISTIDLALAKQGLRTKAVEKWKEEMPTEQEMVPKDKYTMFDRKEKRYRKGVHSMLARIKWFLDAECSNDGLSVHGKEEFEDVRRVTDFGTFFRATEVDEGQPESQSPWLLGQCLAAGDTFLLHGSVSDTPLCIRWRLTQGFHSGVWLLRIMYQCTKSMRVYEVS